jgi:phosphate-selective porin OprO/OprP
MLIRRARLITEGMLAKRHSYQFQPEFGGSTVSILDANLTMDLTDTLKLKVGKFKTPIGLEALQGDAATSFAERSMVANLVPGRDLGVQLGGAAAHGRVSWTAGVFNGLPDGATSSNVDFDEDKDVVARVLTSPWVNVADSPLRGLAFGVAGSDGRRKSTAGKTAGYRTDGQQVFFSYLPAVFADGRTWRVSPQLDYRWGAFGLMGEYAITAASFRPSVNGPKTELQHRGWQLSSGYVLTGENSTYGQLIPKTDFNPAAGTWGAFELFARYAEVSIDHDAFPLYASPANSARTARASGLGFNWFLSKAVVFRCDYFQSKFGYSSLPPTEPRAPVIRQDEKVFITRFQLAF